MTTQITTKTVAQLVLEAKQGIENLTAEELEAELVVGDALVVDIREPDELTQSGTIRGAISAPRGMLEFFADPASPYHRTEFDPARRTILYCASGGRSALAVQSLKQLGFANIAHLEGGLKGWTASGREVSHP